jgi:hypothetical protein
MPTIFIEYTTEAERQQYESMIAYVQEMNALGLSADHGSVLDQCESFALDRGRTLLRDNLQAAVQARGDAEKKSMARGRKGGRRGA